MSNSLIKQLEAELSRLRSRMKTIVEALADDDSPSKYELYIVSYKYNDKQITNVRNQLAKLRKGE